MAFAELIAKLGINTGSFDKGLAAAGNKVESFKGKMGAAVAGAFTVGAVTQFVRSVIDMGQEIKRSSERLNISTDTIQEWRYAARQTGVEIEHLTTFFEKLGVAKEMGLRGGQEGFQYMRAFAQFGIDAEYLNSHTLDQIADKIASIFKNGGDPQKLAQPLRVLAGEMAGRMIPAMREGIDKFKDGVREAGTLIDENVLDKVDEAGRKFSAAWDKIKASAMPAVAKLAEETANELSMFEEIGKVAGKLFYAGEYASKHVGGFGGAFKQMDREKNSAEYAKHERDQKNLAPPAKRVPIPQNPELLKELRELTDSLIMATRPQAEVLKRLKGQRREQIGLFNASADGSDDELRARIAIAKLDKEIAEAGKQQVTPFKYGSLASIGGDAFGSSQGSMIPQQQLWTLMRIDKNTEGFGKGGGL